VIAGVNGVEIVTEKFWLPSLKHSAGKTFKVVWDITRFSIQYVTQSWLPLNFKGFGRIK